MSFAHIPSNFPTRKYQTTNLLLQLVRLRPSIMPSRFNGLTFATEYDQKLSLETVLDIYKDYDPIAIRLLKLADPDGFRVWKLLDMDEIPRWSVENTVLLGDACHPLSPFGFSGASMAIEDALTLSTLLTSDVQREEIPSLFKLYEEIRKPRVARVRDQSRYNAKGLEDTQSITSYMEFLASYDVVEQTKHALSKHLAAKSQS